MDSKVIVLLIFMLFALIVAYLIGQGQIDITSMFSRMVKHKALDTNVEVYEIVQPPAHSYWNFYWNGEYYWTYVVIKSTVELDSAPIQTSFPLIEPPSIVQQGQDDEGWYYYRVVLKTKKLNEFESFSVTGNKPQTVTIYPEIVDVSGKEEVEITSVLIKDQVVLPAILLPAMMMPLFNELSKAMAVYVQNTGDDFVYQTLDVTVDGQAYPVLGVYIDGEEVKPGDVIKSGDIVGVVLDIDGKKVVDFNEKVITVDFNNGQLRDEKKVNVAVTKDNIGNNPLLSIEPVTSYIAKYPVEEIKDVAYSNKLFIVQTYDDHLYLLDAQLNQIKAFTSSAKKVIVYNDNTGSLLVLVNLNYGGGYTNDYLEFYISSLDTNQNELKAMRTTIELPTSTERYDDLFGQKEIMFDGSNYFIILTYKNVLVIIKITKDLSNATYTVTTVGDAGDYTDELPSFDAKIINEKLYIVANAIMGDSYPYNHIVMLIYDMNTLGLVDGKVISSSDGLVGAHIIDEKTILLLTPTLYADVIDVETMTVTDANDYIQNNTLSNMLHKGEQFYYYDFDNMKYYNGECSVGIYKDMFNIDNSIYIFGNHKVVASEIKHLYTTSLKIYVHNIYRFYSRIDSVYVNTNFSISSRTSALGLSEPYSHIQEVDVTLFSS